MATGSTANPLSASDSSAEGDGRGVSPMEAGDRAGSFGAARDLADAGHAAGSLEPGGAGGAGVPATEPGEVAGPNWLAVAREFSPKIYLLVILSLTVPGVLGSYILIQSAFFPEHVRPWIESAGVLGAVAFAVAFAFATGSAILPTYALSFAAGVMLGWEAGALVAVGGVTVGALVGYGWGNLLGRGDVMGVIEKHERARLVRSALLDRSLRDETFMVGLLRFPPNSPFALTNLAMASTAVGLLPFIIGTAVGMAPRTLFAVYIGSQRDSIASFRETGWMPIAGIVIALMVFFFIYRLFSKWAKAALEKRLD